MNCNICFTQYDSIESKPEILWPCCHTFCSKCLNALKEQLCPECSKPIQDKKLNFLGLDIIDQNRFMKQTINENFNKINQLSQTLLISYHKKNDEIQFKLNDIENKITIETNEKIDLIYKHQNELLLQLKNNGNQINERLKEILINQQKTSVKCDELKLTLENTNLIQNKFDVFNNDLKQLENKINSLSNQLDSVDLDFEFVISDQFQFYKEKNNHVGKLVEKQNFKKLSNKNSNENQINSDISDKLMSFDKSPINSSVNATSTPKHTESTIIDSKTINTPYEKNSTRKNDSKINEPIINHSKSTNTSHEKNSTAKNDSKMNEQVKSDFKSTNINTSENTLKRKRSFDELSNNQKPSVNSKQLAIADLNVKGRLLRTKGDYQGAIEFFDKAIALDAFHSQSLKNKALVLVDLKNYDKALECYDIAINLNLKDPSTYYLKGLALVIMKKSHSALECFNQAVTLNPSYVKAHREREKLIKEMQNQHLFSKS